MSDNRSFADYLKEIFNGKSTRNPAYSLRAFARDLNLSHSHLSRVIAGKRRLSLLKAYRIADTLQMEKRLRERWLEAVMKSWSRQPKRNTEEGMSKE